MKVTRKSFISLLSLIFLVACNVDDNSLKSVDSSYKIVDKSVENIITKDGVYVAPFNTVVTLRTFSQKDHNDIYPSFNTEMKRLHILFDRYNDFIDEKGNDIVNLKDINESYGSGNKLVVSQDIINLLDIAIELSEATEGYFNPTLGELIDTWTYKYEDGEKYTRYSPYCFEDVDPSMDDVNAAKEKVIPYNELANHIVINDEENTVEFKKYQNIEKVTISLGAIAKGYAVEKAKAIVDEFNVSAMIDGGSSSSYGIGKNPNPDRDYWLVGLASPYKIAGSPQAIANLRFDETYTLSVSGDYESCYKNSDGVVRHHILNPYSGMPENYYRVISVKSSKRSDILDGLSTSLFNIESTEKVMEIVNNVEKQFNVEIAVLLEKEVDKENKKVDIYLTDNYNRHIEKTNSKYFNKKHII